MPAQVLKIALALELELALTMIIFVGLGVDVGMGLGVGVGVGVGMGVGVGVGGGVGGGVGVGVGVGGGVGGHRQQSACCIAAGGPHARREEVAWVQAVLRRGQRLQGQGPGCMAHSAEGEGSRPCPAGQELSVEACTDLNWCCPCDAMRCDLSAIFANGACRQAGILNRTVYKNSMCVCVCVCACVCWALRYAS